MAVVVGTVTGVTGYTQPSGPSLHHTISSDEREVESCVVYVEWTSGTYASADDANFSPVTPIQDSKRDGHSITILQACYMGSGDENGSVLGAGACTVSANVVTCPLLQEDLSTEHADGAMNATWNRSLAFMVTYHQTADA